jgi:hypothetical protein
MVGNFCSISPKEPLRFEAENIKEKLFSGSEYVVSGTKTAI